MRKNYNYCKALVKQLSIAFILTVLTTNTISAQCGVNGITYTQQAGFGNHNRMLIGGFGTNDGTICWNCYGDSTFYGRHRAFNIPPPPYNPNFPVTYWSARIFQDLPKGVLRIQSGQSTCYDSITWSTGLSILKNGGVGIGTDNTFGALLAVNGMIYTRADIKVNATIGWPDYVFKPTYKLLPIREYEKQVNALGYIPQIGSGKVIENDGLLVGEMQTKQMEVMEIMLRYQFEMNHRLDSLEQTNTELVSQLSRYKTIDSLFTVCQNSATNPNSSAGDEESTRQQWLQLLNVLMKKEND